MFLSVLWWIRRSIDQFIDSAYHVMRRDHVETAKIEKSFAAYAAVLLAGNGCFHGFLFVARYGQIWPDIACKVHGLLGLISLKALEFSWFAFADSNISNILITCSNRRAAKSGLAMQMNSTPQWKKACWSDSLKLSEKYIKHGQTLSHLLYIQPCFVSLFFCLLNLQVWVWVPPTWLAWLPSTPRCLRRNGPPSWALHPAPWTFMNVPFVCWDFFRYNL